MLSQSRSMVDGATDTGAILGTCVLQTSPYDTFPLEQSQSKLWHSHYFQSIGESIQLKIFYSEDLSSDGSTPQITNPDIAFENFVLSAMILYTLPDGRLQ